jgi:hypothetical protein
MPLIRIPYTAPLPNPTIFPPTVSTIHGAVDALSNFLSRSNTLILSGAGISVASGLEEASRSLYLAALLAEPKNFPHGKDLYG